MTAPALPPIAAPHPSAPPLWRRLPVLVLVLVLVVSGLLVWRTLRDGRPAAAGGTVLRAADPITGGERFTVRVPDAVYDVTARVRDDVPDDVAVRSLQAPDDGLFVGVSLTRSAQSAPDTPFFSGTSAPPRKSATVVVDGRQHPLTDGDPSATRTELAPSAYWLAVAGSTRSIRLVITWAGRSQSIDLRTGERDTGDFAPLYRTDAGPAAEVSCGRFAWTAGYRADVGAPAACRYAVDRFAHVEGKGWAPKGRQWLVLRVTTSPPAGFVQRVGSRDVRYFSRSTTFDNGFARHRLDGRAPLASGRSGAFDADGSRSYTMLFSVPSGSAAHTATFEQRVQGFGRSTDAVVEVTQTWTVRL